MNFIDWNNELETIVSSGFDFHTMDINRFEFHFCKLN